MSDNGKTEKKRGRPATGREPSVTIRLPTALLEWIDCRAADDGIGRSEMIRRLIEESGLQVPQTLSRTRTAYHEAGHAVVARLYGISVKVTTVKPAGKSLGHVLPGETVWQTHQRLTDVGGPARQSAIDNDTAWRIHIMMLMAGRESETMVLGFYNDDQGDTNDRRDIKRLARGLQSDNAKQILNELRDETQTTVMSFKDEIRAVAKALLAHETIDQKRLDRIMKEKRNAREKLFAMTTPTRH